MSKLFSLESLDEGLATAELETPQEVGEVADVQLDVDGDAAEIDETVTAIDDGVGAADQLEEVEGIVEGAEEGDGLTPTAADAVRVAVEAICARIGANPKSVYARYATENFQSASSRKANTRFALEGVSDFLKDLWKKIKAAVQRLWVKVKAFWEKHVSSLGRIKKALESMKTKITESSGKLKDKAYIDEAPSSLASAFGFQGDISPASIQKIITAHKSLLDSAQEVAEQTDVFTKAAEQSIDRPGKPIAEMVQGLKGKEISGLVGGLSLTVKFDIDRAEGDVTMDVERETADREGKVGMSIGDKAQVRSIVDDMLKLVNDNIKVKEKLGKQEDAFNKFMNTISKAIDSGELAKDRAANMRRHMKIIYRVQAKTPKLQTEGLALNIALAKGVLGYAAVCVKSYK